jgi:LDH2 family malate/lactate/ureidoglycolate dehydrogenase
MPTLKVEQVEKIAFHLFCAAGAPEAHSRIVAQHLAENNLVGHDSHGFIRVIQYIRQIKEGDKNGLVAFENRIMANGARNVGFADLRGRIRTSWEGFLSQSV